MENKSHRDYEVEENNMAKAGALPNLPATEIVLNPIQNGLEVKGARIAFRRTGLDYGLRVLECPLSAVSPISRKSRILTEIENIELQRG